MHDNWRSGQWNRKVVLDNGWKMKSKRSMQTHTNMYLQVSNGFCVNGNALKHLHDENYDRKLTKCFVDKTTGSHLFTLIHAHSIFLFLVHTLAPQSHTTKMSSITNITRSPEQNSIY